jgi:hypothetical protein
VFEDLAFGKYPKQIYISNYTIQSSNRKKSFSYSFRHKPVDEILRETIDLLTLHTDLISGEEVKKKRDGNEPFKKDTWTCWKDIKKKYIKDMLLMEFCLRLKKDLSLPYKKAVDYVPQDLGARLHEPVRRDPDGQRRDQLHRGARLRRGPPDARCGRPAIRNRSRSSPPTTTSTTTAGGTSSAAPNRTTIFSNEKMNESSDSFT